jgi:heat shock protein HtpX
MARAAAARNILKAWLLLAAWCTVLGLAGWELRGYPGALLFVFCGLLTGVAAYWSADRAVLGMVRARELLPGEAPALHSLVETLSLRAGIVKPRLFAIPDGLPIALATGRGPTSSAIAVSTGLLGLPAPAELEGMVAHEIAHVRNRDVLVQTTAVVVAALLVESSRVGGWFARALLFVLGPVAAAFVHLLLSPKREFEADRLAAQLCESPHGLADGLIRLEQACELVSFRGSPASEPLFTLDPFLEEGLAGLFATHPPVAERVSRLRALDPGWKERLRAA